MSKSIRIVLHTRNSHFTRIRSSFFLCRRYCQSMKWQILKKKRVKLFSNIYKPIFSLSSPKSTIVAASSGVPAYDWDSFFIFELFKFSGKCEIIFCTVQERKLSSIRQEHSQRLSWIQSLLLVSLHSFLPNVSSLMLLTKYLEMI